MIKVNKSVKTKNKCSGFTLAELLIVVAIIAVLVAISIPIFTRQLESARNATDAHNAKVMADAIQIYYMSNPDKIDDLISACKSSPKGYVKICVGPVNTTIDNALKEQIEEAGLLPKQEGYRYKLKAKSKINWIGYYIAVAGPTASEPGGIRIEYAGIPVGETRIPYDYYASYFWPTNKETTGFNKYVRGIQ